MFSVSGEPIDSKRLVKELTNSGAGALVTFEGWVRDHNEGAAVERLEYEVYEDLARKEGERVLAEAGQRFEILDALCVHRKGLLEVGEVAVWVGVTAAHRSAAFEACRFVIDEIKHRLPIWKCEHYEDGRRQWVHCRHHAGTELVGAGRDDILNNSCIVDVLELTPDELAQFCMIDIREPAEVREQMTKQLLKAKWMDVPLSKLDLSRPPINRMQRYLVACTDGVRSRQVVQELRRRGYDNVYLVSGGFESIRRKFIA